MLRTKKTLVVLISGKAGVGKTTIAELLLNELGKLDDLEIRKFGFADPIKQLAMDEFNWDGKKDEKGRKLLQSLGSTGREYDEDTWVEKTVQKIKNTAFFPINIVIIDDWRFPTELDYIKEDLMFDVLSVRVESPKREILRGTKEYDDISEASLESGFDYIHQFVSPYYDIVVDNTGSLEDLKDIATRLANQISEQYIIKED